jgi:hypothetical protein
MFMRFLHVPTLILARSAVAPFSSEATVAESPHPRPKILLVLIDDMGWGDISCFGNTAVKTGNVDRLAAEAVAWHESMPADKGETYAAAEKSALQRGLSQHRGK